MDSMNPSMLGNGDCIAASSCKKHLKRSGSCGIFEKQCTETGLAKVVVGGHDITQPASFMTRKAIRSGSMPCRPGASGHGASARPGRD
jgi:hypothetical protein